MSKKRKKWTRPNYVETNVWTFVEVEKAIYDAGTYEVDFTTPEVHHAPDPDFSDQSMYGGL